MNSTSTSSDRRIPGWVFLRRGRTFQAVAGGRTWKGRRCVIDHVLSAADTARHPSPFRVGFSRRQKVKTIKKAKKSRETTASPRAESAEIRR